MNSGHFLLTGPILLPTFRPIGSQRTNGTIGCPDTSVRNYNYSLRNNPEERSSKLPGGGSLKSSISNISPFILSVCVLLFYSCFDFLHSRA